MATSDHDDRSTSGNRGEWHRWQMEELGYPSASEPSTTHADARRRRQRQDAEAKARQSIAEKARLEGLEQGYREGHEQGYQAGYSEGVKEGNAAAELEFNKRLDMTLAPLAGLADNFRLALASLDAEIADQLVELALIAGRQLAGESLAAKPEHILSVVRELLDADTTLNGKPRLWLNPQDLELVKSTMNDTLEASGWECHADPTLERGGCRATSAGGGLDASLSTQWKAILDQRRRSRTGSAPVESTPLAKGNADDGEAPGE
ncbi:flagellar assembly protein FliH [Salinicola lusitanus]|uniref:flagellar assembly protein FliH n=1 Tax=Salinicola lusitanus TaxID=1949085 RepID=UPI000DA108DC|nr:flagellar assembly protein FliH [Salinicola lusitanus]